MNCMVNISFENFKKQMTDIHRIIEFQKELSDVTRKYNSNSEKEFAIELPNLIYNVVELLEFLTNDESQWISYWVFELDCGRKYKDGMIWMDGKNVPLNTIESLWEIVNKF